MISKEIPNKLIPAFENLRTQVHDAVVMYGGRGSAKTTALIHLGIMESFIDDGVILCCREIQKSIDDSIYSALKSYIEDNKLDNIFKIINNEITNLITGSRFIFAGLKHNITNIKSIDKLRVVLVDEAENVSQESWDYLRPTPRYKQTRTYVVFNPRFEKDATWQEFINRKDDKTLVIYINWYDNPFFPESLNNQRLRDKKGDAGRYNWIWEGMFLQLSDSSILAKKLKSHDFVIDESFGTPMIGVDWGFSTDPTAVIECYEKDRKLYITNAAKKVGLELDDTANWLLSHCPNIERYASYADNARPETISKVRKDGVKLMRECKKWAGSIEDGITCLLSFDEIIVHSDADICYPELSAYSYKKDRFDELTNKPLDKDNHFADALRYAIQNLVTGKKHNRTPSTAGNRTF